MTRGSGVFIPAEGNAGGTVLDALRRANEYIPAVCGGKGTCGKCAVMVRAAGKPPVKVLACETPVTEDIEVTPLNEEAGFEILTGYLKPETSFEPRFLLYDFKRSEIGRSLSETLSGIIGGKEVPLKIIRELSGMINDGYNGLDKSERAYVLADENRVVGVFADGDIRAYGVAVDIGTTTVGLQLVNLLDGSGPASCSLINRQRKFGADVISRIQNSGGENFYEMTRLIREDIRTGIKELLKTSGLAARDIRKMAVSGNTTMMQLFLGIRCESHGHSPFKSSMTSLCEFGYEEIFGDGLLDCHVTLMPGISAFVGSDIVSGLLLCQQINKTFMLVDIGTNGEMALIKNDRIICTSTAAGPAFEGGNISCGTGSVPGAVSGIKYENGEFILGTIADAPPIGLCGTGAIDLLAALLDNELLDETGALDDSLTDGEVIIADGLSFTQKDVREMQLAKSALRSGIECLLNASETKYSELEQVYIAGGFGFKINLDSAVKIGMIPAELKDKVIIIGNSSLGGCAKALAEKSAAAAAVEISGKCSEINLSEDKLFNRLFTEHMYF